MTTTEQEELELAAAIHERAAAGIRAFIATSKESTGEITAANFGHTDEFEKLGERIESRQVISTVAFEALTADAERAIEHETRFSGLLQNAIKAAGLARGLLLPLIGI